MKDDKATVMTCKIKWNVFLNLLSIPLRVISGDHVTVTMEESATECGGGRCAVKLNPLKQWKWDFKLYRDVRVKPYQCDVIAECLTQSLGLRKIEIEMENRARDLMMIFHIELHWSIIVEFIVNFKSNPITNGGGWTFSDCVFESGEEEFINCENKNQ